MLVHHYQLSCCLVYYNYYYYTPCILKPALRVDFCLNLSDIKFPHVPKTLLSIRTDPNNAMVKMVSIHPLIFNCFSLLSKPLRIVLSETITIGITVTFIFYSFFCTLIRSKYLSVFSISFFFTLWCSLFSMLINFRPDFLTWIK